MTSTMIQAPTTDFPHAFTVRPSQQRLCEHYEDFDGTHTVVIGSDGEVNVIFIDGPIW